MQYYILMNLDLPETTYYTNSKKYFAMPHWNVLTMKQKHLLNILFGNTKSKMAKSKVATY
ncbi:hypothetical protein C7N77_10835 [Aeromonas rivipollensis]|nr:hypothetical protein C7N77_10835 [Aeromonas rivipollensis]